jgi:hypothetical protein
MVSTCVLDSSKKLIANLPVRIVMRLHTAFVGHMHILAGDGLLTVRLPPMRRLLQIDSSYVKSDCSVKGSSGVKVGGRAKMYGGYAKRRWPRKNVRWLRKNVRWLYRHPIYIYIYIERDIE